MGIKAINLIFQHKKQHSGKLMKVTVYCSGYAGLVTAACLAEAGHQVICVEMTKYAADMQ